VSLLRFNGTQRALLDDLLSRLERRSGSNERRVSLRVTADRFPDYFDERHPEKVRGWMESVEALAQLEWVVLEKGHGASAHRVERITLCEGRVETIHRSLGRMSAGEVAERFRAEVGRRLEDQSGWVREFLVDEQLRFRPEKLPSARRRTDMDERLLVIDAVMALHRLREAPIRTWRQFVVREFGSSKLLDALKARIVRALAQWGLEMDPSDADEAAILSHFGIEPKEEVFLIHGPLGFRGIACGEWKPFFSVPAGMALSGDWELSRVQRVLTVENEEPFHHLCRHGVPPGWAVVYLAGFPSRAKVRLLKKWSNQAVFFHWGDFDVGGLAIHLFLGEALGLRVVPLGLEEEWLSGRHAGAQALSGAEVARLKRLSKALATAHPLSAAVDALLRSGRKIEQEAMGVLELGFIRGPQVDPPVPE
jgi:hypothetical protein